MKTWISCCSRSALILLPTAGIAWAQATAQLNGTVRDAAAPLIEVKSAGISTVVNNEAILEPPLHHRAGGDPRILQFGVKYAF